MFVSFFPSPRMFFWSAGLWTLAAVLFWFFVARDAGHIIGLDNPPADAPPIIGVSVFWSKPFIWFYIYYAIVTAIFAAAWSRLAPHPWFFWSVLGSILIVFITYFQVQVSITVNNWYGEFYDLIQIALSKPRSRPVTAEEFYLSILGISGVLIVSVLTLAFTRFFVSHYVFRWRTAMNDFYVTHWSQLRQVEGAAQRVQEDTMRFARTTEGLGVNLIDSVMTLIAFLPVLLGLSANVTELPLVGPVPHALVVAAIFWSIFGTGFLALIGVRLPGLEFRNQRVEAAFRKELVYGEDDSDRAQPVALADLFAGVRKNYFRLFSNYLYFNVGRYVYLQTDSILPFLILIPTVVAGTITFGIWRQILNAFEQVRSSFQYLVNSWPSVVELISIYKRLRAFEATIHGDPLAPIELDMAVEKA